MLLVRVTATLPTALPVTRGAGISVVAVTSTSLLCFAEQLRFRPWSFPRIADRVGNVKCNIRGEGWKIGLEMALHGVRV